MSLPVGNGVGVGFIVGAADIPDAPVLLELEEKSPLRLAAQAAAEPATPTAARPASPPITALRDMPPCDGTDCPLACCDRVRPLRCCDMGCPLIGCGGVKRMNVV